MSTDALFNAAKFAIAGTVVGVGVGYAADTFNVMVVQKVLAPTGAPIFASAVGRAVFTVVASSSIAASFIYAGDLIMNAVAVEGSDPLFRLVYNLVAFNGMATAHQGPQAMRSLITVALSMTGGTGSTASQASGTSPAKTGCNGAGGCGK